MPSSFDDVVPKEIAGDVLFNKRSKEDLPEVSQEKSKEGLGEIYEKEYLRLAMGVETETEESKAKVQMAALFKKLCLVGNTVVVVVLVAVVVVVIMWRSLCVCNIMAEIGCIEQLPFHPQACGPGPECEA